MTLPQFAQKAHKAIQSGQLTTEQELANFQEQGLITYHFPFHTAVYFRLGNQTVHLNSADDSNTAALSLTATCAYYENSDALKLLTTKALLDPNTRAIDKNIKISAYLITKLQPNLKQGPSPLWISIGKNNWKLTKYILENSTLKIDWGERHSIQCDNYVLNFSMMELAIANNSPGIVTLLLINGHPVDQEVVALPNIPLSISNIFKYKRQLDETFAHYRQSLQYFSSAGNCKTRLEIDFEKIFSAITEAKKNSLDFYIAYNYVNHNKFSMIEEQYNRTLAKQPNTTPLGFKL